MTTAISTTKEQSDRLIACGISSETADMMFTPHNTLSTDPYKSVLKDRGYSPAWSLSALLELLPKFIPDAGGDFSYALKVQPCNLPGWTVCYYAYSLDKGKGYHRSEEAYR